MIIFRKLNGWVAENMKILVFSSSFVDFMISFCNAISERENVMLMLPEKLLEKEHFDKISLKVKFKPYYLPKRNINPLNIFAIKSFISTVKTFDPDIIHIQAHGSDWFFLAFPFLRKYPIVNTVHDAIRHVGEERIRSKIRIRSGLRNSDNIIVHGKSVKEDLIVNYNIQSEIIHVIPLGNLNIIKNWEQIQFNEVPNSILFFGRIWKYKGLDFLLEAEPIISKEIPELHITIAGYGENFERYRKKIINEKKFTIKNYRINNRETNELFQKTSLVVLPYLEATQSGVVPLAFSFGKPVVVTDVGSLSDIVKDGKTGVIVPPFNTKELANGIIKILKDDNLRKNMGRNALYLANTYLSWKNISDMAIDVYNSTTSSVRGSF